MKFFFVLFSVLSLILSSCGKPDTVSKTKETSVTEQTAEPPSYKIEPVYFLRTPMGESYECEKNGLNVRIINFGDHLSTVMTNTSEKPVTAGADYRIQRLTDGAYRDVPHGSVNYKIGGVHVNDMAKVTLQEYPHGSEVPETAEDGSFTLAPGQSVQVNFLAADHEIFDMPEYAGEYRLIYGGMKIDFRLELDEAV